MDGGATPGAPAGAASVLSASQTAGAVPRRVLHAGCGRRALPDGVFPAGCIETRLDIDPECSPDIVASMTDLDGLGPFDAVYCSHALEHLSMTDAIRALRQFHAVLVRGGFVLVIVPDLEGIEPTDTVLFESDAGPICGIDLMYGLGRDIERSPYMAHRSGFIASTLKAAMETAGLQCVNTRRAEWHNLIGVGARL